MPPPKEFNRKVVLNCTWGALFTLKTPPIPKNRLHPLPTCGIVTIRVRHIGASTRRGSQVVRPRSAKPLFAGSIPAPASIDFSI